MKKLLTLLGVFGVISTTIGTATMVVSCKTEDITDLYKMSDKQTPKLFGGMFVTQIEEIIEKSITAYNKATKKDIDYKIDLSTTSETGWIDILPTTNTKLKVHWIKNGGIFAGGGRYLICSFPLRRKVDITPKDIAWGVPDNTIKRILTPSEYIDYLKSLKTITIGQTKRLARIKIWEIIKKLPNLNDITLEKDLKIIIPGLGDEVEVGNINVIASSDSSYILGSFTIGINPQPNKPEINK
ncbi:hypothetical protein ELUMI_v1c05560 [Williamsoniiplasma luminosum]|uniref:Uncharacterized protein n=1 Tax=Williamsoniiplasma luminosum TaxID=214888 RepID=A0A2K8NTW4_9MOLU|nr:hypothetical protein [Williamsoniiplasma luminosum]ATZ17280.1 hypothetical protein ELUMI_v1c05560 [Williamsoniiplasma luminosum]